MTDLASQAPLDPTAELSTAEQRETLGLFADLGIEPLRGVMATFSGRDVTDVEVLVFVIRILAREASTVGNAHLETAWAVAGLLGAEPPEVEDPAEVDDPATLRRCHDVGAGERFRFLGIDPATV